MTLSAVPGWHIPYEHPVYNYTFQSNAYYDPNGGNPEVNEFPGLTPQGPMASISVRLSNPRTGSASSTRSDDEQVSGKVSSVLVEVSNADKPDDPVLTNTYTIRWHSPFEDKGPSGEEPPGPVYYKDVPFVFSTPPSGTTGNTFAVQQDVQQQFEADEHTYEIEQRYINGVTLITKPLLFLEPVANAWLGYIGNILPQASPPDPTQITCGYADYVHTIQNHLGDTNFVNIKDKFHDESDVESELELNANGTANMIKAGDDLAFGSATIKGVVERQWWQKRPFKAKIYGVKGFERTSRAKLPVHVGTGPNGEADRFIFQYEIGAFYP